MLGEIRKGKVTDENQTAFYVQVDGVTFELKKIEVTQDEPIHLGAASNLSTSSSLKAVGNLRSLFGESIFINGSRSIISCLKSHW